MIRLSIWRQLKRRLRRSKRGQLALGCAAAVFCAGALAPLHAGTAAAASSPSVVQMLQEMDEPVTVIVNRIYICGEETKPIGQMKGAQAAALLKQHPDWTAFLDRERHKVIFAQHIEELSQLCTNELYMGIDRRGNLSLFDGLPREEKVMRTFFQLDVNFMESSLPEKQLEQLIGGIKISDMDEYNSVLSTFSDYAVNPKRKNVY
ncbi:BofC C-terminal domain-containing protein [Paenibacillus protaetiae]|uniref:Bypass of forespore C C-terminal domain-containing protein n=1 Tax=Paenibacillus protaetiae TaxID=2509456 RepID=A0A4P6EX56_9BACL|nr:BofC C-terminal domain-containing protein [Paenibacillus protaetiae]QAY65177.1 hypothetical protein ET464_01020 [Paenibacillus protaetiae]